MKDQAICLQVAIEPSLYCIVDHLVVFDLSTESLILAQDERWRQV
jgi:hypothetical protein